MQIDRISTTLLSIVTSTPLLTMFAFLGGGDTDLFGGNEGTLVRLTGCAILSWLS